ncbi:hypothetical protein [Lachnoclostridium sp.]|nr:hypothetical protein [Lachnoclostridium sp.]
MFTVLIGKVYQMKHEYLIGFRQALLRDIVDIYNYADINEFPKGVVCMEIHNCNLNIHYTASKEIWEQLSQMYTEMPYWIGFVEGIPHWYGTSGKQISASVEPSGLQLYAELPQEEWEKWLSNFKSRASIIMGYEVGEPEEGFDFSGFWDDSDYAKEE